MLAFFSFGEADVRKREKDMEYECGEYPTYMGTHFVLFHYNLIPVICSQWKMLMTSLKTISFVKENLSLFKMPDPWPLLWSMSLGLLWSACLSAPFCQLVQLNTVICSFFPKGRFYPISCISTFRDYLLSLG